MHTPKMRNSNVSRTLPNCCSGRFLDVPFRHAARIEEPHHIVFDDGEHQVLIELDEKQLRLVLVLCLHVDRLVEL